jgi:hypothetical protein
MFITMSAVKVWPSAIPAADCQQGHSSGRATAPATTAARPAHAPRTGAGEDPPDICATARTLAPEIASHRAGGARSSSLSKLLFDRSCIENRYPPRVTQYRCIARFMQCMSADEHPSYGARARDSLDDLTTLIPLTLNNEPGVVHCMIVIRTGSINSIDTLHYELKIDVHGSFIIDPSR